jgi:hypothetical protein
LRLYRLIDSNVVPGVPKVGPGHHVCHAVNKGRAELVDWLNLEIYKPRGDGFFLEASRQHLEPYFGEGFDPKEIMVSDQEIAEIERSREAGRQMVREQEEADD